MDFNKRKEFGLLGVKSKRTAKIVDPAKDKKRQYKEDGDQGLFIGRFKERYPGIHIRVDAAGRNKKGWELSAQSKQNSGKGFPDITIYASRCGYSGLLLETKKKGVNPILKSGSVSKQQHFRNQYESQLELRAENYCTYFVSGIDELERIAFAYMDGNPYPMITDKIYVIEIGLSNDDFFTSRGL